MLRDLHSLNIRDVEKQLNNMLNQLSIKLRGKVRSIIVKHAIEAWLLADPNSVKKALGHKTKVKNPETLQKPDKEIDYIALKCGKR